MTVPFGESPIFRRAKREAASAFQNSPLGQLTAMAEKGGRKPIPDAKLRYLLRAASQQARKPMGEQLRGTDLGSLVHGLERYARGGNRGVVDSLLKSLGPAGGIIRSLMGSKRGRGTIENQIETAIDFLKIFRPGALREPSRRKAGAKPARKPRRGGMDAEAERMAEILEAKGYQVFAPGEEVKPKTSLPFGVPEQTKRGGQRKVVDVPMASGGSRRFKISHPIITGEMLPTPESSNVHSYGYDVESWYLYVRFRAPGKSVNGRRPNAPGSLYRYSHVPPEKFLKMFNASSKGKWIWSNIRIRGTLSGHQHDYALVGVVAGYVPRKATLKSRNEEWFMERTVRGVGGRAMKSRPSALARTLNTGEPAALNRGTPNNGSPNTGAP